MKVYLSGKITGDSNYRQKFSTMTEELLSYGYVVFNPAVLPNGFEYSDYMALDLLILSRCDAIFLLRDWKKSPGARLEYEEAKRLGLQVLTEDDLKIRRTLNQLCEDTIKLSDEDEKKRRFSQMLIAAGDLMDMAVSWKDERESA